MDGNGARQVRRLVKRRMGALGLDYQDLGRRLDRDPDSVADFIDLLGTRKHHLLALSRLSRALNWEGEALYNELVNRGLIP